MTREQLEAKANRLIASAKATVELQGDFPLTIFLYIQDGWQRLPFPKELEPLMNHGGAKDAVFDALREVVQHTVTTGVIFACDTWHAETTKEGEKHYDTPEWKRLHDTGFVKLVQRGWVKRSEAFTITAQRSADVLIIRQMYQRLGSGTIQLLDCKREWFDQSAFGGRQKMFGDLKWENLGSEAAVKGGAPQ